MHLVNRDYEAMCRDYYTLEFMDRDVDTSPIAPALAAFFDDVLDQSVTQVCGVCGQGCYVVGGLWGCGHITHRPIMCWIRALPRCVGGGGGGLLWWEARCGDVDTSPIAPALAAFFDDVLDQSVTQVCVEGLGRTGVVGGEVGAFRGKKKGEKSPSPLPFSPRCCWYVHCCYSSCEPPAFP